MTIQIFSLEKKERGRAARVKLDELECDPRISTRVQPGYKMFYDCSLLQGKSDTYILSHQI